MEYEEDNNILSLTCYCCIFCGMHTILRCGLQRWYYHLVRAKPYAAAQQWFHSSHINLHILAKPTFILSYKFLYLSEYQLEASVNIILVYYSPMLFTPEISITTSKHLCWCVRLMWWVMGSCDTLFTGSDEWWVTLEHVTPPSVTCWIIGITLQYGPGHC